MTHVTETGAALGGEPSSAPPWVTRDNVFTLKTAIEQLRAASQGRQTESYLRRFPQDGFGPPAFCAFTILGGMHPTILAPRSLGIRIAEARRELYKDWLMPAFVHVLAPTSPFLGEVLAGSPPDVIMLWDVGKRRNRALDDFLNAHPLTVVLVSPPRPGSGHLLCDVEVRSPAAWM